jgi:hypothetical protein
VTGIAGNDAHQNVGVIATVVGKKIILTNPLGKRVTEVDQKSVPPFLFGVAAYHDGDNLLKVQFDPYAVSLGYVSTHLVAKDASENALFEALLGGRAYVAFDWMADPSGFVFTASDHGREHGMGDDVHAGARLAVRTSTPGKIRLLRNGDPIASGEGRAFQAAAAAPGVYRVEITLPVAGTDRPWIYSNPIYVR